jgi:8-oxo-dGTP pyrophosphatase MutT (NUDIX family)
MASVGPGNYVLIVVTIGGSKASYIKLVPREPRTGKTWFPAGSVLPYEEHVDAAVHELHEETCLILTSDDLTMLINNPVRVSLP